MTRSTKLLVLLGSVLAFVAFAPVASAAGDDGRRPGASQPTAIGRWLDADIGRWAEASGIGRFLEPNAYRPGLKHNTTRR